MADKTPPYIRGFIVPYALSQNHFWLDQSTITQNGSIAGVPQSQNTSLIVTTRGQQTKTIELETKKAGHIQDGAAFAWKFQGDALQYGMEPPNKVMDIIQRKTQTLTSTFRPHDSIVTTDGDIVLSYTHLDTGVSKLEVIKIDSNGVMTSRLVDSVNNSSLLGNERFSALCELPDKSIILAAWAVDEIDEVANINIFRTIDNGISWTMVQSKAIQNDIDVSSTFGSGNSGNDLDRITIAATSHQVMLLAGVNLHDTSQTHCSQIYQFASTNEGLSYKFIGKNKTDGTSTLFGYPDVVTYNDFFIISYFSSVDTLDFIRFNNAFDSLFDVLGLTPSNTMSGLFANLTNKHLVDGDKSMHLDPCGRLYVYVCRPDGIFVHGLYSDLAGVSSDDYAKNWFVLNNKTGTATNLGTVEPVLDTRNPSGNAMGGIESITTVSGQGNQYLFANWKPAGVNAYAQGIFQINFGGWTTQQYPKLKQFAEDYTWGHNIHDYVPTDLPTQGTVWTKNSSGTPTESLLGDKLRVTATNADTIEYEIIPVTKTNGIVINTKISNVSGSSVTRGVAFGCQIQQNTSKDTYYFEIVVGNNFVYVYDIHAGFVTPVGNFTGLSITDGIGILVYLDNSDGKIEVFVSDSSNPRQYQNVNGTLITDVSSNQKIYWGIPTSTGTSTPRTGDYHYFSYGLGDNNGLGLVRNQINHKLYSAKGFQTSLIQGLLLSTLDGPARQGDSYTIEPQYNAPIERTLHNVSQSPEIGWRSDGVANPDTTSPTAEDIAWMIDSTVQGAADTQTINEAVGLHLTGINFRSFNVQKYNAGVGWSTIATVDNSVGGSFSFTRSGASIQSNATNGTYLNFNECVGWYVLLDNGAGTQVVREITSNPAGVFANTTSKRSYLILGDVKNSDPTSGTAYLIPNKCSVIINESKFAGIRIQITSQRTNQGYFKIGTMVLGGFVVTSPQYGRGRTITFQSNTLETETPSGTLYSQKQGSGGRIVRISWTDGVDISSLLQTNANPDYYKLESGSAPIAAVGSAPTTMMGIVQYCTGSVEAIVYLPSVETNTGSPRVFNRYNDHVLATLGPDIEISHVIGEENLSNNQGEVFRVSTIILREVR